MVRLMGYSNKLEGTSHDTIFYCMTIDNHHKKNQLLSRLFSALGELGKSISQPKKIRKSNSLIEKMLDPHLKSSFNLRFKKNLKTLTILRSFQTFLFQHLNAVRKYVFLCVF